MNIARSRLLRSVVLLLSTVLLFAACAGGASPSTGGASPSAGGASPTTPAAPISIGVLGPLTGGAAKLGIEIADSVQLAVDERNASGGVLGVSVELVRVDDECDAAKSAIGAQILADNAAVMGVIGALCSSATIPASDVLVKAHVAMISPASSSPEVTDRGLSNMNRVTARDDVQGPGQAVFLVNEMKATKVAVIDDGTTGPKVNNDLLQAKLTEFGVDSVRLQIRAGDKDFRAILGTIPKDVDAIAAAVYAPEAALLAVQSKEIGLHVPMISTDGSFDTEGYIKAAAGAAEGNFVTFLAPDITKIPSATAFYDAFSAKYGEPPAAYGPLAYEATNILLDAIVAAGSAEREKVETAVRATNGFTGILGYPISFDDKGDIAGAQIYVYKVVGSSFVYEGPVSKE